MRPTSTAGQVAATPCLLQAWQAHQAELLRWLAHRVGEPAAAQDLLQDVFLKALRQGSRFCEVTQARAWLFEVARNTLTDHLRRQHPTEPLPGVADSPGVGVDELPAPEPEPTAVVDQLTGCLARVLTELSASDADIIRQCDLNGMRQQDYATAHGLGLPATKARLQRARQRLRQGMTLGCQIQTLPGGGVVDFVPR